MFSRELTQFLEKNKDKKIVFTNGCFDILHRGHVTYLAEARKLGDLLVIGVNADASVKRLKGPERPINNEKDRCFVLSQLKSVDFTEIFTEDTPLNLILEVKPKVLVKGGDWKIDQIVGGKEVQAMGGQVFSLNFVDGYSTTSLIEKIQHHE
ncbi:MAG: D-glycero-beta-D-manno-heptose 1-phosphate adenylyltransferase [Bdellovibrionota bacterium]